jgi:hypothetical protein
MIGNPILFLMVIGIASLRIEQEIGIAMLIDGELRSGGSNKLTSYGRPPRPFYGCSQSVAAQQSMTAQGLRVQTGLALFKLMKFQRLMLIGELCNRLGDEAVVPEHYQFWHGWISGELEQL